ncbi:MAG: DUF4339 domain-containing protein [Chlamydiales bacterium]|nr:DUF4339 domain-containing protein [Chlamydiales bacterium]
MGGCTAYLAHLFHRNPFIWFVLGFLFGVFALIALLLLPPVEQKTIVVKIPVAPAPDPLKMKTWYYLDEQHQQVGPLEFEQMRACYIQDKIGGDTFVWSEGMEDWLKVKDIDRLEQLFT